tara:strand:+ start:74 stop:856 length:783 start_codon:yes stop_codon:yes gene_type:complete
MINKYFTVEVKPTIPGEHQAASSSEYNQKDVLFDWTSFQIPKGASKLTAVTAVFRGTNGGVQVARDLDLVFAKSINGTAPATLGNSNASVSAAPVVANHIIGLAHLDSGGDFGASGFDHFNVASTGSGAAASLIPELVLEGEPQSGDNVGFDTLYIGGIAGAAFDFGTTVLVRGAITADNTVTIPTDKGTNDDPDADLIFTVGDVLETATGDTVGTVASISAFDTNHQDIILTAKNVEAIANNEELFNVNPIRLILSFEK